MTAVEHAERDEEELLNGWPAGQAIAGRSSAATRLPAVGRLKAQRHTGEIERWLTARPPSGRCRGTSRGGSRERGRRHAAGGQRGAVPAEAKMSADSLAVGGDVAVQPSSVLVWRVTVRPRS